MSLFRCEECNTVENTATSRYWLRASVTDGKALCSTCDPGIGKWHGIFPREQYDPSKGWQVNNPPEEIAA